MITELKLAKHEYYMDDFLEFMEKMMAVYVPESVDSLLTAH